jgi:hypothetical protein
VSASRPHFSDGAFFLIEQVEGSAADSDAASAGLDTRDRGDRPPGIGINQCHSTHRSDVGVDILVLQARLEKEHRNVME